MNDSVRVVEVTKAAEDHVWGSGVYITSSVFPLAEQEIERQIPAAVVHEELFDARHPALESVRIVDREHVRDALRIECEREELDDDYQFPDREETPQRGQRCRHDALRALAERFQLEAHVMPQFESSTRSRK
jgi:hypothetical protein